MTRADVLAWLSAIGLLATWLAAFVAWRIKGATVEADVRTLMQGEPGNPNRRAARVDEANAIGERVNDNRAGLAALGTKVSDMVDHAHQSSAAIIAHIEAGRREASERDARLSVQLAKLEGQIDVCGSLEKVGERIVDVLKSRGD